MIKYPKDMLLKLLPTPSFIRILGTKVTITKLLPLENQGGDVLDGENQVQIGKNSLCSCAVTYEMLAKVILKLKNWI
jgi:hypothetical protein